MVSRHSRNDKNGFTLLELLIVISIIGILVALVLANLQQAKNKGRDAGVRSNLANARSQAELYYTNNNSSYAGVCNDANTGIMRQIQSAKRDYGGTDNAPYNDGSPSTWETEACNDTDDAYVAWVPLSASQSSSIVGLCIDSTNITKEVTAVLGGGGTQCP